MAESLVQQKESLVRRASFLRLASRTIAENMKSGNFRSLYKGQGVEFAGVRDYIIGDDIRAIDWNVTARMARPFVKLFEEERELNVFFLLDCSSSLFDGNETRSKIDTAIETAAILIFAAEHNACPIGSVFFDGDIKLSLAPKTGGERVMVLIKKLDELSSGKNFFTAGSELINALSVTESLLRKRSLIFVISDFRVAGYEDNLARLSHKHDCVAIKITAPQDVELPPVGALPFYDRETNVRLVLPTSRSSFRRKWQKAERLRTERWHDVCVKRGVFPLEISTEDDAAAKLVSFFEKKRQDV